MEIIPERDLDAKWGNHGRYAMKKHADGIREGRYWGGLVSLRRQD